MRMGRALAVDLVTLQVPLSFREFRIHGFTQLWLDRQLVVSARIRKSQILRPDCTWFLDILCRLRLPNCCYTECGL